MKRVSKIACDTVINRTINSSISTLNGCFIESNNSTALKLSQKDAHLSSSLFRIVQEVWRHHPYKVHSSPRDTLDLACLLQRHGYGGDYDKERKSGED